MREVEPTSVPARRLRKAQKLFAEKIHGLDSNLFPAALVHTHKWVCAFHRVADIILKAEGARPKRKVGGGSCRPRSALVSARAGRRGGASSTKSPAPVLPCSMMDRNYFDNEEKSVLSYFAALELVGLGDGLGFEVGGGEEEAASGPVQPLCTEDKGFGEGSERGFEPVQHVPHEEFGAGMSLSHGSGGGGDLTSQETKGGSASMLEGAGPTMEVKKNAESACLDSIENGMSANGEGESSSCDAPV